VTDDDGGIGVEQWVSRVTPGAVLRWTGVAFVIALEVLVVIGLIGAFAKAFG
jgi:hypothetical protein